MLKSHVIRRISVVKQYRVVRLQYKKKERKKRKKLLQAAKLVLDAGVG